MALEALTIEVQQITEDIEDERIVLNQQIYELASNNYTKVRQNKRSVWTLI